MRPLSMRPASDATGDQYGDTDDGLNAVRRRRWYEKEHPVAAWTGDFILNINSSSN